MRIRTLCRLAVLGSCLGASGSGVQGAEAARIGPRRGLAARPARYGSRAPGVHERTPEDYGGCLITQMPGAGASPEAVAFSRRLR